MKNGGCEDLVAAAPRQPQLVKQGAHLSGLCDLLRGFRLKILVYCFAFHPTINFGLVSLRPVLTKRGKYILGWNQDFKVVLSKLSSKDYLFGDLLEDVGEVGDEVGVEHLLVGAAVVLADGVNQVHQGEHLVCRHLQVKHLVNILLVICMHSFYVQHPSYRIGVNHRCCINTNILQCKKGGEYL